MYYEELINFIKDFSGKLGDDESRELFDARMEYFFKRDEDRLQERVGDIAIKYKDSFLCWGLELYYMRYPEKRMSSFIVFGAGNRGRGTIRALDLLGKKIEHVVDNSPLINGSIVCGHLVEAPSCIEKDDTIVVVAVSGMNKLEIYYQLIKMGIKEERILMPPDDGLFLDFGKQYFDVDEIKPNEDGEIFVDGGCFDGGSSVSAARWANGHLQKIYAFEPDKDSIDTCEKNIKSTGCEYELHNIATWDKKEKLRFDVCEIAHYGSRVSETGGELVEADSIDNILNGRPVTYIKLDVEGSELKTLLGAKETILKWRPKLAVSIYHKPEDIIEIPSFLEGLNLGYGYYIRHYQSRICETILYAI